VLRVQRVPVTDHIVVRLTLEGGDAQADVIEMSPEHPTGDGRTFADLRPGDELRDRRILDAARVPYTHSHTHDILPASETGTWFAAGAMVGSSLLSPARRDAREP